MTIIVKSMKLPSYVWVYLNFCTLSYLQFQLGHIKAKDKDAGFNSQVHYSLHGTSAGLFRIDDKTGAISVADAGQDQLDRELQRTVELQVC